MATVPTTSEIKDFLRNEKPTEDDAFYSAALDAAVQTMNDECQHQFAVASATATPRTFVPAYGSGRLFIGDCTTVTSVVENGVTLTVSTNYHLEPVNTVNAAGLTVPYSSIRRRSSWWYTFDGTGTVVVTATWGWTTIPVRVVEAIKILTKDIIENRDARGGLLTFGDQGLASSRPNSYVNQTIAMYRGERSWGIG